MKHFRNLQTNTRGETIIEVLIALSILGFVLGISYSLASRSLQSAQDARERGEALVVGQGQVELVRHYALREPDVLFDTPSPGDYYVFCLGTPGANERIDFGSAPLPSDLNAVDLSVYPAECIRSTDNRYHTSIEHSPSTNEGQFTVRIRWEKITGDGYNEVKLLYRITEPVEPVAVVTPPVPGPLPGPTPPPSGCSGFSTVTLVDDDVEGWYLGFSPLGESAARRHQVRYDLASPALEAFCSYTITVTTAEDHEAPSPQQPFESLYIEGYNNSDSTNPTFRTEPTLDIPECTSAVTLACTQVVSEFDITITSDTHYLLLKHLALHPTHSNASDAQTRHVPNSMHYVDIEITPNT